MFAISGHGIHLVEALDLVDSPRRSAVAALDAEGRLAALELVRRRRLVAPVPPAAGCAALDAPSPCPTRTGSRRRARAGLVRRPGLPVSRRRLAQLHGGARGVGLAPASPRPAGGCARPSRPGPRASCVGARPPPGRGPRDLGDYRAAGWARAPGLPPQGRGRARGRAARPAWRLLAEVLDLGGGRRAGGDDGGPRRGPARRALLRLRGAAMARGEAATVGDARAGRALPAGRQPAGRVALTIARLRAEGPCGSGPRTVGSLRRSPVEEEPDMGRVYRVIDVIGTSDTSGRTRHRRGRDGQRSLRDLRVAEVTKLDVTIGRRQGRAVPGAAEPLVQVRVVELTGGCDRSAPAHRWNPSPIRGAASIARRRSAPVRVGAVLHEAAGHRQLHGGSAEGPGRAAAPARAVGAREKRQPGSPTARGEPGAGHPAAAGRRDDR